MTVKRNYGQFCGLAAGLNIVGERWTLLIIRELLLGPARFSELIDNLVGIGPGAGWLAIGDAAFFVTPCSLQG